MKKNIYFAIFSFLALVLIVAVPCLLKNTFLDNNALTALYVTSKVIWGLMFVGAVSYALFANTSNGVSLSLVGIASLYQFLPLVVRALLGVDNATLWVLVLLIASLMIFVAIVGGIITMNKKMVKSEKASEGKTIEIFKD